MATWHPAVKVATDLDETGQVDKQFFVSLARKLNALLYGAEREAISSLAAQLSVLLKSVFSRQPPAVADELKRADTIFSPISAAFVLGQISFAHQLASDAVNSHCDTEAIALAKNERYQVYIRALSDKQLTGVELAGLISQRPETVSRKLGELRELGFVECRRQGTAFVNFLTPLGHSILGMCEPKSMPQEKSSSPSTAFTAMLANTEPKLRTMKNFSQKAA